MGKILRSTEPYLSAFLLQNLQLHQCLRDGRYLPVPYNSVVENLHDPLHKFVNLSRRLFRSLKHFCTKCFKNLKWPSKIGGAYGKIQKSVEVSYLISSPDLSHAGHTQKSGTTVSLGI